MTNPIKTFLLFCSGSSGTILRQKGCEVEHNKYAGIGATILFTAALAALSGGYAMFAVFRSNSLAIMFGLFWGLIIFNLDRFIVASIRKPLVAPTASVRERLAVKAGELGKALPRLLLAFFISIVITKPLELKLFQVEIRSEITKNLSAERLDLENRINSEFSDIGKIEQETENLRGRLTALQNELSRRVMVANNELEGGGGTYHPGDGPEYKRRIQERDQAQRELDTFKDQYAPIIKANEARVELRKKEKADKIATNNAPIDDTREGLLKRLEALSGLATLSHPSIFLANLFIVLLFISLETAPILVKLLSNRGAYDDALETIEHEVHALEQKKRSDINDDINTAVALSTQLNADRLALQLSQNTMAAWQRLAPNEFQAAQLEIAQRAIELWKAAELLRINRQAVSAPKSGMPTPAGSVAASVKTTAPAPGTRQPAVASAPIGSSTTGLPFNVGPSAASVAVGAPPPIAPATIAATAAAVAQSTGPSITTRASASSAPQTASGIGTQNNVTQASPASSTNNPGP